MLSTILYGRRFFPYYVYNIIGGLDEEGRYFNTAVKATWHVGNQCTHSEDLKFWAACERTQSAAADSGVGQNIHYNIQQFLLLFL